MIEFFCWTDDEKGGDEPEWLVAALTDGRIVIEASGTQGVCLVINGRRFRRGSTILRSDVECGWAALAFNIVDPEQ